MKIKIRVTKEILQKSMYCGIDHKKEIVAANCAIANAAQEFFPGCLVSYMMDNRATPAIYHYPDNGGPSIEIPLPFEAKSFMMDFDSLAFDPVLRLDLREQSFEVDVPNSIIDEIGIGEAYRILSESKTLELVSI